MKKTLFKDAALITLDPSLGFLEKGDLLIEGAHIVEVGPSIEASGADVVDASDMVIMPGLVDTHRHVWQSVIRGIGTDWSL